MSISASESAGSTDVANKRPGRVRTIISAVLLTLAVLVTPVIVTSVSVGVTLTDADRFGDTFGPAVKDPQVQAAVADAISDAAVNAVRKQDPAAALERYLEASGASAVVQASARLLGSFALEGLETATRNHIETFIASDTFSRLWDSSLRAAHATLTGAVGDDTDGSLLRLDADGTLWLNATVVAQAAADFIEPRSATIAGFIPTENIADVRLAHDPAFAQVRAATRAVPLLITVPLVVGAVVLVAGLLCARRRMRALAWTLGAASVLTVSFGILVGSLTLPTDTPQQVVIGAFAAQAQSLISGPAVTVALILAVITLIGSVGTFLVRTAASRNAASA